MKFSFATSSKLFFSALTMAAWGIPSIPFAMAHDATPFSVVSNYIIAPTGEVDAINSTRACSASREFFSKTDKNVELYLSQRNKDEVSFLLFPNPTEYPIKDKIEEISINIDGVELYSNKVNFSILKTFIPLQESEEQMFQLLTSIKDSKELRIEMNNAEDEIIVDLIPLNEALQVLSKCVEV